MCFRERVQPGDVPLPGKPGVRVLPLPGLKPDPTACPQNAEGKPELLGLHDVTPVENFYVRKCVFFASFLVPRLRLCC